MFLCVTPYGLVYRYQLFYQNCRILLHGSEDFNLSSRPGYLSTKLHGVTPYSPTWDWTICGYSAVCISSVDCKLLWFAMPCTVQTLQQHLTYCAVNVSEIYLKHFVTFLRLSGKMSGYQDSRRGVKEVTTSSFHAPSHAACCYYLVPGTDAGDVATPWCIPRGWGLLHGTAWRRALEKQHLWLHLVQWPIGTDRTQHLELHLVQWPIGTDRTQHLGLHLVQWPIGTDKTVMKFESADNKTACLFPGR